MILPLSIVWRINEVNVLGSIFPMIDNWRTNKIIRTKIEVNSNEYSVLNGNNKRKIIKIKKLKQEYDKGIEQKKILEDKAKTNVVGITIAISLIMGAGSLTRNVTSKYSCPIWAWLAIVLILFAVFYMIFAGLMSIKVITNENQIETVPIDISKSYEKEYYDCCIRINNDRNLIRNNYVYSAYECIRNALICLSLVFFMSIIPVSKRVDEFNPHSNCYEFYFEQNALPIISSNDSYIIGIENSIKLYIENNSKVDDQKEIAIVDSDNKLFIRFVKTNDYIRIIDIQEYEEVD